MKEKDLKKKWNWPNEWLKKTTLSRGLLVYTSKDFVVSATLFLVAVVLCMVIRHFDPENDSSYVAMIFLLDVFLTAMLTDGFLFSIFCAVLDVLCVDYIFTEPYWEPSFTVAGFPVTFVVMMTITIVTGILTSGAKQRTQVQREAQKEKMRGNLLRAVSHDLRTPLTSIVGATNVLLEDRAQLSEEQKIKLLTDVNEEAQWLVRMVENLLSVTRIGEDTGSICKMPEAAEEVMEETVRKFGKRYPLIETEVILPQDLLLIPMDAMLIEQVLMNLVENAAVHGKTTKRVVLRLEEKDGEALFSVEDDGMGISRLRLPTLFDGMLPAEEDHSPDTQRSMGIGLSVCKTIVQAHGGHIYATNGIQGGAVFSFTLPLTEEDRNENQRQSIDR